MPVELSVVEAAFVLTMVGLGALIQGSLGFGLAFAVAPALALVRPEAVPATIVLLSIPMVVLMAMRERGSIRVRDFLWITAGRLPGTLGRGLDFAGTPREFSGDGLRDPDPGWRGHEHRRS
jgi:uncharacterized protein